MSNHRTYPTKGKYSNWYHQLQEDHAKLSVEEKSEVNAYVFLLAFLLFAIIAIICFLVFKVDLLSWAYQIS